MKKMKTMKKPMLNPLNIIILAAGKGTRMKSDIPKVMHLLAGKPLLQHIIETAQKLSPKNIYIIYGHQGEKILDYFKNLNALNKNLKFIRQHKQLGTAHAVQQALPELRLNLNLKNKNNILILSGDVPLICVKTLKKLITQNNKNNNISLLLLTAYIQNPSGLGRIIRDKNNNIIKIIEEKDATPEQKKIQEINAGIYLVDFYYLEQKLDKIKNHNKQQEYYLTDLINPDININNINILNPFEIQGVNTRTELNLLERYYQKEQAKKLMAAGVSIMDINRIEIRGSGKINIAKDVILDINIILEGNITIKSGSIIGPNCILKNTRIGKNVEIKSHCVIENAVINSHCKIGPFARIRPGSKLAEAAMIGNFVEIKNSNIGKNSKIPHLSYVGDTDMGKNVNFGAGAITCNYNGVNKNKTIIGNNVFIGSDSQLIAPVEIHNNAFIGAGSTITKTAPKNKLTLSRAKQVTLENWIKPQKPDKNPEK